MALSGRSRMMTSVNTLTGSDNCSEAILAQERPKWSLVLVGLAAACAGFLVTVDGVTTTRLVLGVLIGVIAGSAFVVTTTYWIIARCGDRVLLARSSKLSAKAVEVVESYEVPLATDPSSGLMQFSAEIGGRRVWIARQFRDRLNAIVG